MTTSNIDSNTASNAVTKNVKQIKKVESKRSEENQVPIKNILDNDEPVVPVKSKLFNPEPIKSVTKKHVTFDASVMKSTTVNTDNEQIYKNETRLADDEYLMTVEYKSIIADVPDMSYGTLNDNKYKIELDRIDMTVEGAVEEDGKDGELIDIEQIHQVLDLGIENLGIETLVKFYKDNLQYSRIMKHNTSKYVLYVLYIICNTDNYVEGLETRNEYISFSQIKYNHEIKYALGQKFISLRLGNLSYTIRVKCDNVYVAITPDHERIIEHDDEQEKLKRQQFESSVPQDSIYTVTIDEEDEC